MKVSIITVCFNAERFLENAIRSVLEQTYTDIEYIIVDGMSTDGTMGIVGQYQGRITRVISEPDRGVYDAMNKGARAATGEIIYFLNSDDRFCDNQVVSDVVKEFVGDGCLGFLFGNIYLEDFPGSPLRPCNYASKFLGNKKDFISMNICHQAIFCRKWVFDKVGFFNLRYKIYADFDWVFKVLRKKIPVRHMDRYVAYYYLHGLSGPNGNHSLHERREVLFKYLPWSYFKRSVGEFLISVFNK